MIVLFRHVRQQKLDLYSLEMNGKNLYYLGMSSRSTGSGPQNCVYLYYLGMSGSRDTAQAVWLTGSGSQNCVNLYYLGMSGRRTV